MATRGLLVALLLLTVSPQTPPLFPVHVESPLYPPLARMARIQGDIVVSALVGTDGHVIGVPNAPSGHPLLAKVAEENIKTWRFQSGVEGEVKITYHFKMQGKPTYGYPETICEFDFPDSITIITNVPAPNP